MNTDEPATQRTSWVQKRVLDHRSSIHNKSHCSKTERVLDRHIHLAFTDYKKAFDSLDHDFMLDALSSQGIPNNFVNLIQAMSNLKAIIKTDKIRDSFSTEKGVKQGDPLSLMSTFLCCLEVFKGLNWKNKEEICRRYDIVLIFKNSEELK